MSNVSDSIFALDHRFPLDDKLCHVERLAEALSRFASSMVSDHERFLLAERLSMAVYPEMKISEHGRMWLRDGSFFDSYRRLMDAHNWHSADRKYTLTQFARWAMGVPGHLAECGVYKGASAFLLCEVAAAAGRHVHLFDSFAGLSEPREVDGRFWASGRLSCSQAEVESNLDGFSCFTCYKGWIPERFGAVERERFSLVHIDVDLHDPTRESLEFFYPRLTLGGVMVLDDHGFATCPGARQAALDFAQRIGEPVIDLPTGQGLLIRRRDAETA